MPSVLVCSSLGPGKEYAAALMMTTLRALQGVDSAFILLDGIPSPPALTGLRPNEIVEWLASPPVGHLTGTLSVIGRIARVREAARQFFLQSRNRAGERFSHLYFHDSDMVPPEDILPRLLARCLPVVSGFYACRGTDPERPVLPMMTRLWDDKSYLNPAGDSQVDQREVVDGCITPLACGMGCLLVEREVMARTPFRAPESFGGEKDYGEDIRWCLDCGEEIVIDVTLPVWHVDADGQGIRPTISESEFEEETLSDGNTEISAS